MTRPPYPDADGPFGQFNHDERRHIGVLRRRRDHLAGRINPQDTANSYIRAELAALDWVLNLLTEIEE